MFKHPVHNTNICFCLQDNLGAKGLHHLTYLQCILHLVMIVDHIEDNVLYASFSIGQWVLLMLQPKVSYDMTWSLNYFLAEMLI